MQTLYHYPICPLSRQIRVYLKELDVKYNLIKEDYWMKRKDFVRINPASNLPVLVLDIPAYNLVGTYSIIEYLTETYENFHFMHLTP